MRDRSKEATRSGLTVRETFILEAMKSLIIANGSAHRASHLSTTGIADISVEVADKTIKVMES